MTTPEERARLVAQRYDGDEDEARQLEASIIRRMEWRRRRGGKECARCRTTKSVRDFGADQTRKDGLRVYCRSCRTTP